MLRDGWPVISASKPKPKEVASLVVQHIRLFANEVGVRGVGVRG